MPRRMSRPTTPVVSISSATRGTAGGPARRAWAAFPLAGDEGEEGIGEPRSNGAAHRGRRPKALADYGPVRRGRVTEHTAASPARPVQTYVRITHGPGGDSDAEGWLSQAAGPLSVENRHV